MQKRLEMNRHFSFLCGNFEKINFIYATKFADYPWHYFEERDSIISEHDLLPAELSSLISKLDKVRSISVTLNELQWGNYYENSKFVFKNKELKTFMELASRQPKESKQHRKTTGLVFISGQSNPLLFLDQFEKCPDVKLDKDKMFKIRNFVDDDHKGEFSEFFFTSDWPTVRHAFLKKYSYAFTVNKKRELSIDFNEECTLRSFVQRKLSSLTSYTTLPFINQMEMVLNDLPNEVSDLFILNQKLTCDATEILDFCDSIQELVGTGTMQETMKGIPQTNKNDEDSDKSLRQMEIFNYDPDMEPEFESVDNSSQSSRGRSTRDRGRGKGATGGKIVKRGRPTKKLKAIYEDSQSSYELRSRASKLSTKEDSECDGYEFLDDSSRSSL